MEKLRAAEYKKLPEGSSAVICGKVPFGTTGEGSFSVLIGKVAFHKEEAGAIEDLKKSGATYRLKYGDKGWISLKPKDEPIEITPLRNMRDKVELSCYKNPEESYSQDPFRTAFVEASWFKSRGFDLNMNNPHSDVLILSPEISQLLYDFQQAQGQFRK